MSTAQASDDQLVNVPPEITGLLTTSAARRLRAVPLGFTDEQPPALQVAMRDPDDPAAVEQLRALSGHRIAPLGASSSQLGLALDRHYTEMSWSLVPTPRPAVIGAAPAAGQGAQARTARRDGGGWSAAALALVVFGVIAGGLIYLPG